MSNNNTITTKFWDKIAPGYAKDKIKDLESYEKKLKATQERLTKDMSILEVGCGTGMTAVIHAPFVKHVHATDISPAMIKLAKGRAQEANIKNISFQVSDVASLAVKDASQDAVLAMSVIHLLDNPKEDIQTIYNKLKPGGRFISSTMCLGDKMNYVKLVIPLMRLVGYAPSVVHFFKKDELVSAIEAANFSIEHVWQPSPKKAAFIIARKA